MNPEEAKNFCSICGDPITTQHEIDFELCDECFAQEKEDAERNDPDGADRNCEL